MDIEKLLNKLIEEKQYDKRLIPFIKKFFLYNMQQQLWNEKTVEEKIKLCAKRINGIEFVDLGESFASFNSETNEILINDKIKQNLSAKDILDLTSEIFIVLEEVTKNINENELMYIERNNKMSQLKYTTNKNEKKNIIEILSNTFNLSKKEIYSIKEILYKKLENVNDDNKAIKDFLDISINTCLPEIEKLIPSLLESNSTNNKKNGYISLYAISLLAFSYRLDNTKENKQLVKKQYNNIQNIFNEQIEEYAITAEQLKEHKINSTWTINIEKLQNIINEQFKKLEQEDINIENSEEEQEDSLINGLGKDFFYEIANSIKNNEEELTNSYTQSQIAKITKNYDEKFSLIIDEYFKRSIILYNWTKDEFNKKVNNYIKGVKEISFEKVLSDSGSKIAGWSRGRIEISKNLSFINSKQLLSTFMHEQEHATDDTSRNQNQKLENGLYNSYKYINEYATEIGAMHLLGDKIYDDSLCFTHSMGGYEEFKYAGSMISAALGISEFEFAKLRDKGENKFNKVMEEKFGYIDIKKEMLEFNQVLEQIEKAPLMFNMKDLSEAYAKVYNMSTKIIYARQEHENREKTTKSEKEVLKTNYEYSKIANNMQLAIKKLHLKKKYIKSIVKDNTIIRNYTKINSKEKEKYLNLVEELYPEKNVHFNNEKILQHINKKMKHPILGKIMYLLKKDKILTLTEGQNIIENYNNRNISETEKFANKYRIESTNSITNNKGVIENQEKVIVEDEQLEQ